MMGMLIVVFVDEFGRVVDGDLILYVCGKYLKDHGELANDTVVTTIMSNIGLYKLFDKKILNMKNCCWR